MFLGHYAIGFATKKAEPKVSLGTYFMAAIFLDLLWPLFLLLGLEHVKIEVGNTVVTPLDFYDYPISHSLLMAVVWSLVFGGIYFLIKKNQKASLFLGLCVFSHWILDFIVHRPDLPLSPGVNVFLGLGIWNSIPATLIIELLFFAGGIYLYVKNTKAKNKLGFFAMWCYVVLLLAIYVSNIYSPPPPSLNALEYAALGQWLFIAWGYWIDKHRDIR